MYKAKIIKMPESGVSWINKKHKVGDIIEVADYIFQHWVGQGVMESLEHYRMVTVKRERCSECGKEKLVRKKIILEW